MRLLTIGHSNHPLEKFFSLLEENGIMILVDVRSAPYSRYNPQFNKEALELELPRRGLQYVFAGKYLGGRPPDPACYKSQQLPAEGDDYLHEVDYPAVMRRPWFIKAIDQLLEIADTDLTAVMCSEEDPAMCHRHHLIARYLLDTHPEVQVSYIRGDGTVFGARSILKSVVKPDADQLELF